MDVCTQWTTVEEQLLSKLLLLDTIIVVSHVSVIHADNGIRTVENTNSRIQSKQKHRHVLYTCSTVTAVTVCSASHLPGVREVEQDLLVLW